MRTQHAEIIQNHQNRNVPATGQGEACVGNKRGLNWATVRPMAILVTKCGLEVVE
jgi:hypothetical protein